MLAFLSKETTLFWVPALFLAREFSRSREVQLQRGCVVAWCVTVALLAGYLVARQLAVPDGWSRSHVPLSLVESVGTRLAALTVQLIHVVNPQVPVLSDAMPIVGIGWPAIVGGAALVGLTAGALRWRGTQVGWVLGFCLVALAPSLNLVPLPRFTSPHYGYLLSFGMGMSIALAVGWMRGRSLFARRWGFGGLALWTLLASALTCRGGFRFEDNAALFGVAVESIHGFLRGTTIWLRQRPVEVIWGVQAITLRRL